MEIEMQPVNSSNILEVGYDQDTEKMYVTFNSGITYVYDNVPFDVYTGLMDADSIGSYFHTFVRSVYTYAKL